MRRERMERRGQTARPVPQERREQMERRVPRVHQGLTVRQELRVRREPKHHASNNQTIKQRGGQNVLSRWIDRHYTAPLTDGASGAPGALGACHTTQTERVSVRSINDW